MKKLLSFGYILPFMLPIVVLYYLQVASSNAYNYGIRWLDDSSSGIGVFLLCAIIYIVTLLTVLGIFVFFLYKLRLKEVFVLILILSISFWVSEWIKSKYQPGYVYFMNGFESAVRDKVSFRDIEEWLSSFEASKPTEWLDKSKWPDFISSLSPNEVIMNTTVEGKKYVLLEWGGPPGHYGVVVGVDSNSLPLDVYMISEYRKDIEEDVFIWHELK